MGVSSNISLIGEFQPLDHKKNKKNLVWLIQHIFVGKKKGRNKTTDFQDFFCCKIVTFDNELERSMLPKMYQNS